MQGAPGLVTSPNLYTVIAKPSGAGGSVAYKHATGPLRAFQAEALRRFDAETKPLLERRKHTLKADYDAALAARKQARKEGDAGGVASAEAELDRLQIELAAIEVELVPPYVWVNDSTPERLASLMAARGETMAHFDPDASDSVAGLLGTRYGNGAHEADSLHLKSYSRESLSISRQGSGRGGATNVFLESPCMTVLFVLTPDILKKLLSNERMLRGGLLARCLMVNSRARPVPWALNERAGDSVAAERYERAAFAMLNTYRNRSGDASEPIGMTAGAWQIFADRQKQFCDSFDPELSAFEARHVENALRIALVLHAWQHVSLPADGPAILSGQSKSLQKETALAAWKIADWFIAHQEQILEPFREAARSGSFERFAGSIDRRRQSVFGARDLIAARVASDAKEAERIVADWQTAGRVVREPDAEAGPGRPAKPRWRIVKLLRKVS
jgi:hypothetical protein